MKKASYVPGLIILILSLIFTSCGAGKKLSRSEAKVDKLQRDSTNIQSQLNDCIEKVKNLNQAKASLQNEYSSLQNEYSSLQNEFTAVQNDSKVHSAESKITIADQAKRLKTLQDMIQSQKDLMANLKNSIANALMKYKSDELYVYTKDGNVYVSLEEKLLFKSGSDVVDPKGKEALKSLAIVLNNTNDITVVIEGHTDNIPIKTNLFKDNWDLSTARATSIVRILTIDNGFDPSRITASGKSQFHPVKTNETDDGRSGNRRTEIILSPDLKEIFKILYQ
jgi:chemotaxis protein MotB